MLLQEQEAILGRLHEWLATERDIISQAMALVRSEGVSNYPILLVTRQVGLDLGRWGVVLPVLGEWRAACSTLERWVSAGWLLADKVDEFRALYKAQGLGQACVMVLDAENSSCVFVNLNHVLVDSDLESD